MTNKNIVMRFNKEVIEDGNAYTFNELISDNIVNYAAAPGADPGKDGMRNFLLHILRKGFPDIKVKILDQIEEEDKVVTRKEFSATHLGEFMGVPATGEKTIIRVIDIIQLENGKYTAHWASSNIPDVLKQLSEASLSRITP